MRSSSERHIRPNRDPGIGFPEEGVRVSPNPDLGWLRVSKRLGKSLPISQKQQLKRPVSVALGCATHVDNGLLERESSSN